MKRHVWALALLFFSMTARADDPAAPTDGAAAAAEEADPAAVFKAASAALVGQRPAEAIAKLESLSDRGVVDAVSSFDRGLAYADRVRLGGEQPGDLGRAVQGFEEARDLTHDAALANDASQALVAVRAEIARRRARAGDPIELEHGQSLGRAIVSLLPENTWAILAALFSVALTVAIAVRWRAEARRAKVGASTAMGIALGLLLVSSINLYVARKNRLWLHEGVVVSTTRLLDARHVALDGVAPVAEGARVTILDESTDFAHVAVGRVEGWLPAGTFLPLAKQP